MFNSIRAEYERSFLAGFIYNLTKMCALTGLWFTLFILFIIYIILLSRCYLSSEKKAVIEMPWK